MSPFRGLANDRPRGELLQSRPKRAGRSSRTLLDRYVALWEQADIPGLVALLQEDAWFTMPPIPAWFQGRSEIATLFRTSIFTTPRQWRLHPTHANASPAFGLYQWHAEAGVYQLFGLLVLGLVGEQIALP